jgi:hypothetical protein
MSRGKQVSRRKFLADAAAGTAAFTIVPLAAECVMPPQTGDEYLGNNPSGSECRPSDSLAESLVAQFV